MEHRNFTSVIVRKVATIISLSLMGAICFYQKEEYPWMLTGVYLSIITGLIYLILLYIDASGILFWKKLNRRLDGPNEATKRNQLLQWDEDKLNAYFSWLTPSALSKMRADFELDRLYAKAEGNSNDEQYFWIKGLIDKSL